MSEQFINQNTETVKKDLIEDIHRRQENGIIEKTNADLIIKLINNAEDSNEALMIAALGTTYNRTGFQFDKRLEKTSNTIKYFKKNEELSFSDRSDKPHHKMIIGDNYDALQNLLIEYKGKIDVIYIDPPYGSNSMGEFAETSYDNSITRDNLLSMLYPRLVLAKQLLSDEGVLFCSIDDKNQAYVKCLFDEIFNENNFIANIVWQSKRGRDNSARYFSKAHEYCLVYAKKIENVYFNRLELDEETKSAYTNPDSDSRGPYRKLACWARGTQGGVKYDYTSNEGYYFTERLWLFSKENLKKLDDDNKLIRNNDNLYRKMFIFENEGKIPETLWIGVSNAANASDEIKSIFGKIVFDTPKPTPYIKEMLKIASKSSSIVLDFFAGSGTIGQAVLEQNKIDNGNRTFIAIQLDENLDEGSKETTVINQLDLVRKLGLPKNLSSVTFERLNRIMTGHSYKNKDEGYKWQHENEPYGGSLDVYEIAEVSNSETQEGKTPFDVIDETLYGKEKFENANDKIKWVCENFDKTQRVVENDPDYQNRIEEERNVTRGN